MKDDFVGFILSNKIKLVFAEDPTLSVHFPDDEIARLNEALEILSDLKFEIKVSEE